MLHLYLKGVLLDLRHQLIRMPPNTSSSTSLFKLSLRTRIDIFFMHHQHCFSFAFDLYLPGYTWLASWLVHTCLLVFWPPFPKLDMFPGWGRIRIERRKPARSCQVCHLLTRLDRWCLLLLVLILLLPTAHDYVSPYNDRISSPSKRKMHSGPAPSHFYPRPGSPT